MNVLYKAMIAIIIVSASNSAQAFDPKFNQTLWTMRIKIPKIIGQHEALMQTLGWCLDDAARDVSDSDACKAYKEVARQTEKNTLDTLESCRVVVDGLRKMDTQESRLHLRPLEIQLQALLKLPTPITDAAKKYSSR